MRLKCYICKTVKTNKFFYSTFVMSTSIYDREWEWGKRKSRVRGGKVGSPLVIMLRADIGRPNTKLYK